MKLLCAISDHGLGHLAQTAPILNAIHQLRPDMEWLIWSGLSHEALVTRLEIPFQHRHDAADVGLRMQDAVHVDVLASANAYLDFHHQWEARITTEAGGLEQLGIDGVLSNAAYLPLAAAHRAGLTSIGFCSLNWWDIARQYISTTPAVEHVLEEIRTAYLAATTFLRLTPGMAMGWMDQLEVAPPVASLGSSRRKELNEALGLSPENRLVLLGFGGVDYQPASPLPVIPDIIWLTPDSWPNAGRNDLIAFGRTHLTFKDLLASCDALVTKVGYGSFVEAAGLGLPVLYLDRPDWPETPELAHWLQRNTVACKVTEAQLFSSELGNMLAEIWSSPAPPPAEVSGAPAVGQRILDLLAG